MKKNFLIFLLIAFSAVLFVVYLYAAFLFSSDQNSFSEIEGFLLPPNIKQLSTDENGAISFLSLDSSDTLLDFYRNKLIPQGWEDNKTYAAPGISFLFDTKLGPMSGVAKIANFDIHDPVIGPTKVTISFWEIDYSAQP